MVYRIIKTVKGRLYVYEQRTWREGRHVRTESRYIGPLDGQQRRRRGLGQKIADLIKANRALHPNDFLTGETLAEYNARVEQEEQARLAKLDDLYAKYGLHLAHDRSDLRAAAKASAAPPAAQTPAPVQQNATQPARQAPEESPSADEGQGSGNGENAADGAQNS